jgi:hypothetical protein
MCRDSTMLSERLYPSGPLVVLLDMFSVHQAAMARAITESLGIQVVVSPPGCPDTLPPLHRCGFGVLNAHARQFCRTRDHGTHAETTSDVQIAENLIVTCARITPETSTKMGGSPLMMAMEMIFRISSDGVNCSQNLGSFSAYSLRRASAATPQPERSLVWRSHYSPHFTLQCSCLMGGHLCVAISRRSTRLQ